MEGRSSSSLLRSRDNSVTFLVELILLLGVGLLLSLLGEELLLLRLGAAGLLLLEAGLLGAVGLLPPLSLSYIGDRQGLGRFRRWRSEIGPEM